MAKTENKPVKKKAQRERFEPFHGFQPKKLAAFKPEKLEPKEAFPPSGKPTCPIFMCWAPLKVATHVCEGKRECGEVQGAKYEVKTHWCPNCGWGGRMISKELIS